MTILCQTVGTCLQQPVNHMSVSETDNNNLFSLHLPLKKMFHKHFELYDIIKQGERLQTEDLLHTG